MEDKSKRVARIYDQISKGYNHTFSTPSEHIDDFLKLLPRGGEILDVGCGPGIDSAYMSSRGFKVLGIDLSEKMFELAKENNPNVQFKQQDIRTIDPVPESFDGIFASYSLIHVPKKDIQSVIKNFFQILKPNGTLAIGIQEGKSEEVFIPEPFLPDEKIFLNIMSVQELHQLLQKYRFTILNEFSRKPKKDVNLEFIFNKLVILARKNSL